MLLQFQRHKDNNNFNKFKKYLKMKVNNYKMAPILKKSKNKQKNNKKQSMRTATLKLLKIMINK